MFSRLRCGSHGFYPAQSVVQWQALRHLPLPPDGGVCQAAFLAGRAPASLPALPQPRLVLPCFGPCCLLSS